PPGGEADWKNSAVHETEVSAVCLSDHSRRADFLELIENQERIARIFRERFDQGVHRSQRFFARKNRTLFKAVDVLPGKLPRLIEQQRKRFRICDSTHGRVFFCWHTVENRLSYQQRPIPCRSQANSKCVFVPSRFNVSHLSIRLIAI